MSLTDIYIKNSNIPKRYLRDVKLSPSKADEKVFKELNEIKLNVKEFVNSGENLLICSKNVGNGKTTFATKILKEYINQVSNVVVTNQTPVLFINISNFLNEKKLAISDREIALKVADLEKKILSSKLVVFDDLGVKDLSQYDSGNLYYWIDYRTSNMLSTIYTSNLLPQQLEKLLDSRVYSRVVNYSKVKIITDGDSRRRVN